MKFHEKIMKKRCGNCMFFEQGVHEKTRNFEKGEIVLTLAGCSRMRVGEGSPEKKKYEK